TTQNNFPLCSLSSIIASRLDFTIFFGFLKFRALYFVLRSPYNCLPSFMGDPRRTLVCRSNFTNVVVLRCHWCRCGGLWRLLAVAAVAAHG
ncbi:hypothetical protein KSS87_008997, partial [Heliosperma pusillum]